MEVVRNCYTQEEEGNRDELLHSASRGKYKDDAFLVRINDRDEGGGVSGLSRELSQVGEGLKRLRCPPKLRVMVLAQLQILMGAYLIRCGVESGGRYRVLKGETLQEGAMICCRYSLMSADSNPARFV